jgi:antitoxin HigA-1
MQYFKVLSAENQEITTNEILHPGDVLEMELSDRGIKKKFAALQLGVRPSHLSDLLNRKRHVSALLAIKLQLFLGISADFWMRVQAGYDLAIAWQQMADSPLLHQSK